MRNINNQDITEKSLKTDLLSGVSLQTVINYELGITIFDDKSHDDDNLEIQNFFYSKAKLFEPDLISNKNINLIKKNMDRLDIKKIREEFGMIQQDFADLIGINRKTVMNWEKGMLVPKSKIKHIEFLVEQKRVNDNTKNLINTTESSELLESKIEGLIDHIKTLKGLIEEKTIISDMYKSENLRLKEEIELLKNKR